MRRRAFTILELTLATAIGSMMVLACLALFAALGRHEKLLAARTADTAACERAHLVLQRALETMLMVADVAPKEPALNRAREVPSEDEEPRPPRTTSDGPPRLILGPDPTGLTLAAPRPGAPAGGELVTFTAQTLELVLPAHPVAPSARGRQGRAMLAARGRAPAEPQPPREDPEEWRPGEELDPTVSADTQAVRGIFELRPSPVRSRREPPGYSLWWRPVERPQEPGAAPVASAFGPVELISGLAWAKWSVFQGRQWRDAFEASYVEHLPAYVRFHGRTVNGYDMDWLFEIRWIIGPEFQERPTRGENTENGPNGRAELEAGGAAEGTGGAAGGAAGGVP